MSEPSNHDRVVEVFADISCPFAHVGLRRWVERRDKARPTVRLHVMAWPLELVNGNALDGPHVAETIARMQSTVAPDLFKGFRADRWPPTTLPALRLTHDAYRAGVKVGESVALELRDRLFERGEDVSNLDVLKEVATDHGLQPPSAPSSAADDPVLREWAEGQRRGVLGSPHYFAPGIDLFCPLLDLERADDGLLIEESSQRFDRLCEASFA